MTEPNTIRVQCAEQFQVIRDSLQKQSTNITMLTQSVQCIHEKTDRMHELICGNGEPERGLLWKIKQIERSKSIRGKVLLAGYRIAIAIGLLLFGYWLKRS